MGITQTSYHRRLHHKIYLNDARNTAPGKLKTAIRHPIRKVPEGI